jgi:hypothetical protein
MKNHSSPALYASLLSIGQENKRRDSNKLFCNVSPGWDRRKFQSQKPLETPSEYHASFPPFFDSPLKFPFVDPCKREDCIWTRQMGSRLYRLNSTFYNGTKGINRNAIRYDSKFICMQDRTGKIASEGDIENQADVSHLRARQVFENRN